MLELKNFPFQLHKRVSFSKKEKEKKKKFFSSSVTTAQPIFPDEPATSIPTISLSFFSPLPPFPFSVCNRVTVNVSQSWSRVIWRASDGGIEHGEGKEKYTFTLLDSKIGEDPSIDSKDSKVLVRAAFHFLSPCPTSFHPPFAPLSTTFLDQILPPPEGRRKSNTR